MGEPIWKAIICPAVRAFLQSLDSAIVNKLAWAMYRGGRFSSANKVLLEFWEA